MASMRDIKRRKESIQSTGQITKAMKLVATVKLQKARTRAEHAKPYFDAMYRVVTNMLARSKGISHPYLQNDGDGKKAVILITSNRGLAGGYNSNVIKQVLGCGIPKEEMRIYPIGRKGKEYLSRRGFEMGTDYSDAVNEPEYRDAAAICQELLNAYTDGEISEIYLAYTRFVNTVSQVPDMIKLLPMTSGEYDEEQVAKVAQVMEYEPEEFEALNIIIPKYLSSMIYGAMIEAVASENGARMTAMDNATSNAEEMIDDLSLKYNRARQGSITQELTEIIAGANAIS